MNTTTAESTLPPSPTADQNQPTPKHPKPGKFRFKSSSSKSHSKRDETHPKHRHHRHKHRHRHRRRSASPAPTPSQEPEPGLSADTAFRESLFDALGDDEGAAYWESVYGQPIHNYAVPSLPKGPDGELEQMDEEEYASYVRRRMWERTREGMLAEQERLRAERARERRREERMEEETRDRVRFERAMEESLRRGKERRRGKAWRGIWEEYVRSWGEVDRAVGEIREGGRGDAGERLKLRNLLFWPVESGKRRDVGRDAVEEFMRRAPGDGEDLAAVLKAERVRWHPDKIQHRYGALGIDEAVMRSVTEVFQIVDDMWSETKGKQS
ncbi:hypothetical protein BDV23DRAFT_190930 [Aspergillus alliaceus]|uniref:J domain-containing protein n=1 Tax=Petromyces alliaceus TaxID=209559 RepID=A0A5N7BU69_PETAA|nr:hypothetical protein BDV23DRAFT_190930 [Aspergillus alliaceus]